MPQIPLRLAAVSLMGGGLALGIAPLPLANFGCPAALSFSEGLDSAIDVTIACADDRAERQTAVGVLLSVGLAGMAASLAPGRRAEAGEVDAAPRG